MRHKRFDISRWVNWMWANQWTAAFCLAASTALALHLFPQYGARAIVFFVTVYLGELVGAWVLSGHNGIVRSGLLGPETLPKGVAYLLSLVAILLAATPGFLLSLDPFLRLIENLLRSWGWDAAGAVLVTGPPLLQLQFLYER